MYSRLVLLVSWFGTLLTADLEVDQVSPALLHTCEYTCCLLAKLLFCHSITDRLITCAAAWHQAGGEADALPVSFGGSYCHRALLFL